MTWAKCGEAELGIRPGKGLKGLKAGDAITVFVQRTADDPADTCSDQVFVQAINVICPMP